MTRLRTVTTPNARTEQADGNVPSGSSDHVIGAFVGKSDGPTLIVIGSLHGNEPAGFRALAYVAEDLTQISDKLRGRVYFLEGNTRAIKAGVRFVETDLNREWTADNLAKVGTPTMLRISEGIEMTELDQTLDSILITAMDEVFVIDLHSTSAEGKPFATVGDTLRNRQFARQFPLTILLGIEEQLDGTLLEHLNNAGAVTMGFEGGQHDSRQTVHNHEALVWLALVNAGILKAFEVPNYTVFRRRLGGGRHRSRVFEVRYRHSITPEEGFEMEPGFNNFDRVRKGQLLGADIYGPVTATESGIILMPLYQKLGKDGFFIGREVSQFWLQVSEVLRRAGLQKIVHLLPGVMRDPNDPGTLVVNTAIAALFPLQIFHLLGFRRRRWVYSDLVVSRRKHDTDGPFIWKGV